MGIREFLLDNSWLLLVLVVAGALLLSWVAVRVVERYAPREMLKRHHDVTNALFGVVGMVYAVLLAFVVLIVWEQFNEAKRTVDREAAVARTLMQCILRYDAPGQARMRSTLKEYVDSVAKDEFRWMASGDRQQIAANGMKRLNAVWDAVAKARPAGDSALGPLYGNILERMNDLGLQRSLRSRASRGSIPWTIWTILVIGGLITVGFSLMFTTEARWHRMVIVGGLSVVLAMIIFTIALLDHPFQGAIAIEPDGYERIVVLEESMPPAPAEAIPPSPSPAAAPAGP